jgi:molecular chaperone IbpA
MTRLTTLDLPHFTRATIGFDRLFDEMTRSFENTKSNGYPPYNIEQINDNEYMITLAVAGFAMEDLDITLEKNVLTIEGSAAKADDEVNYLHKGIGGRNFRRSFTLAEHIEVEDAGLDLGMLNIHLKRNVPEAEQPKKIQIRTLNTIEG